MTQLCVLKDGYVVQFRVFYFPATCTDLCVLSRLWILKCRNHHRQHFDLPQVINTGGGNTLLPADMMRQWHLCLPCYYHTGHDAMWKGRGAARRTNRLENPYPVPTSPDAWQDSLTQVRRRQSIVVALNETHCWFPGPLHDVRSGHSALRVNLRSFVASFPTGILTASWTEWLWMNCCDVHRLNTCMCCALAVVTLALLPHQTGF